MKRVTAQINNEFVHVEFESEADAEKAIEGRLLVNNREVKVKRSQRSTK